VWTCRKCRETVEDTFDACWNCGTSRDGSEDPILGHAVAPGDRSGGPLRCLRCDTVIEHLGTKRFHEGTNWGLFGEVGEWFVKRQQFDVYACPRCGRVELFVDGGGEQQRTERT
jgi:hypothetical protein